MNRPGCSGDCFNELPLAVGGINAGSAPAGVRLRPVIRCWYGAMTVAWMAAAGRCMYLGNIQVGA